MEKLLNVIASRLEVCVEHRYGEGASTKYKCWYEYKQVSEEVKEKFEKELYKHAARKLAKLEIDESIEYIFNYSSHDPYEIASNEANENLLEVFQKLPSLPKGEKYTLPYDTYFEFILMEKTEDCVTALPGVSDWIKEAYNQ